MAARCETSWRTPLIVAAIGMGVERFALRRVYDHGPSQQLLLTFGLAFVCEELIKTFYGNYPVAYLQPHSLDGSAFTVFGASYPAYRFFVGVVAVLMFATLYLLLHGTRIGIIVRAAVQRPAMVSALGHNVSLAFLLVFGVWSVDGGNGGGGRRRSPHHEFDDRSADRRSWPSSWWSSVVSAP